MKTILTVIYMAMPFFMFAQYTYDNLKVNCRLSAQETQSLTYENLRLYPIQAKDNFINQFRDLGHYMALHQALEKKKVRITEKGNGMVNTLSIENISGDTIIIITGEIIKGGKQDRIIEKDMLLEPKSGKKDISVFCVESGRWSSGRGASPEFKREYAVGTMSLRKVVEEEHDQQKVWSKVEEINKANKTQSSTAAYTAIGSSKEFTKKLDAYLQFFKEKFSNKPDVIGVLVVSGDKVLGCDMFANPDLFKQNYENLLHAYATEAILNGKPVTISPNVVKIYLDRLLDNEKVQAVTLKEKGKSFVEKGKKLRISSFD